MRRHILSVAIALSLLPAAARAGVGVHIDLGLPAAPPLVAVQPGVQVVEGVPDEVFYSGGWYWCRRPDGWYRARSPQASFYWVEPRRVPVVIARTPVGYYRNWHHAEHREHERVEHREHERVEHREHERAEHREWRR